MSFTLNPFKTRDPRKVRANSIDPDEMAHEPSHLDLHCLLTHFAFFPISFFAFFRISLCMFVCLVALRPKSTAMVMAGRSVHLTTLFPGQA